MATSKIHNWVEEETTTVGTGVITVTGVTYGHAAFDDQCADGELVNVTVKDGGDRESGLYTFTSPDQLARTFIHEKMVSGVITKNPGTGLSLSGAATVLISQTEQYIDARIGADWVVHTVAATLTNGENALVDTNAGAITMTLPPSPRVGEKVCFADYDSNFSVNNLTVARNGSNIEGLAEDLVVDVDSPDLVLVYVDVTKGWIRVAR